MAGVSAIPIGNQLRVNLAFDDDCDRTVIDNIDAGPTDVFLLVVDNTQYGTKVYVHIWDDEDPVIGTDGQDFQFPVAASTKSTFEFREGLPFSRGASFACSTGAGTGASGEPATPPDVYLSTSGGTC